MKPVTINKLIKNWYVNLRQKVGETNPEQDPTVSWTDIYRLEKTIDYYESQMKANSQRLDNTIRPDPF